MRAVEERLASNAVEHLEDAIDTLNLWSVAMANYDANELPTYQEMEVLKGITDFFVGQATAWLQSREVEPRPFPVSPDG